MFGFTADAFAFTLDETRFDPSDPFAGEPQALIGDDDGAVATGLPTGKREIAETGTADDLVFEDDHSGFTLVELLVVI